MSGTLFIEPPQYKQLAAILNQHNNVYVLGPPGSGKTTTVHSCLNNLHIPYRRINYLQCITKSTLLQAIAAEIQALWKIQVKVTAKFSELIVQMSQIVNEINITHPKRGYIIIDAPQLPQQNIQYIYKMFALTDIKSEQLEFHFIVICNHLPEMLHLPLGVNFILKPLDEKFQIEIIFAHLVKNSAKLQDIQLTNQQTLQQLQFELAKDIVVTFSIITNNLTQIIAIALNLFEQYIFPIALLNVQNQSLLKGDYSIAKRLLLDNPNAQIKSNNFKRLVEEEIEGRKIRETSKTFVERKNAAQSLEDQYLKLPKIPAIILLASYYCQRNSEKSDKMIFRDKKKNKKSKAKEQFTIKQRIPIVRIIAIVQSLLSLNDNKELESEKQFFNQSILFYQSIQLIIDEGYVIAHNSVKDDDLNRVKLECQITEKQAFQLAESLGINFYEFLYQQ